MREKDKGRSLWHGESVKQGQNQLLQTRSLLNKHQQCTQCVSLQILFSLPGPALPLTRIIRSAQQWSIRLAHSSSFCSSIQTKGEKWGQSGQWGFAKGGAGGWSIFFCTCESQKLLIVISVTALTTAAQTLKQTAATLQTEREIWERASKIETPSKKTSV